MPSKNFKDTAHIVSASQAGDAESREEIARRCQDHLRPYVQRSCPRTNAGFDCEDVLQEATSRVLQGMRAYRPRRPGGFWAWSRKIANNVIRDLLRRSRRGPQPAPLDAKVLDSLADDAWATRPDLVAEHKEEWTRLAEAMRALPSGERAAVQAELAGIPRGGPACSHGPSAGLVRKRLTRAHRRLRRILAR